MYTFSALKCTLKSQAPLLSQTMSTIVCPNNYNRTFNDILVCMINCTTNIHITIAIFKLLLRS